MCNGTESTLWNCQYDIASTTGEVCNQQQETSVFCMCKLWWLLHRVS